LGFGPPTTDEQLALLSKRETAHRAGLPTVRELVKLGGWLCGPPDRIIEGLRQLQEACPGMEEVMVAQPGGTPYKVMSEQAQIFPEAVRPAFRAPGGEGR